MRNLLFLIPLFIACKSKPDLYYYAVKGDEIHTFENSMTIKEYIPDAELFAYSDYNLVAQSTRHSGSNHYDYKIEINCKFPRVMKTTHRDGILFPVYQCRRYRKYGMNLCQNPKSNFKKIKEFYLNPNRRNDYPYSSKNATIKFVVNESKTLGSISPMINQVKTMRDKISDPQLKDAPFLMSLLTTQRDSNLLRHYVYPD